MPNNIQYSTKVLQALLRALSPHHKWSNISSLLSKRKQLFSFLNYKTDISRVGIDATNMCQLNCAVCPNYKDGYPESNLVEKGYFKYSDFKNLIDANPNIKSVELAKSGELFLHPELEEIIEYAYKKKVTLTAENGVNLNSLNDNIAEALVKHQFKHLVISIDGATNETYRAYRIGGDLNVVLENIKKINKYKSKYNSNYPSLVWQFIIFGHNEHELSLAKKMADELGMSFKAKLNYHKSFSPVVNKDLVRQETNAGIVSREEYKAKTGFVYLARMCFQFWEHPQINWDGKLLGCCMNDQVDYGNICESSLEECLNSAYYQYTKKVILGKESPTRKIPCSNCIIYNEASQEKPLSDMLLELRFLDTLAEN